MLQDRRAVKMLKVARVVHGVCKREKDTCKKQNPGKRKKLVWIVKIKVRLLRSRKKLF